ncbi:kelch repeat-containing protein [uncultured Imperialibacter sp.]|uniref:fibronectin type III domain-containing protein n=1 Tax=uncultured Imperialibacter sp. TaxID=1672639 RepID=UPI0030DD69D6|tara:strand:+ start:79049 stop:87262 length:8214 start_codon:yes stop_codon:yes gene_type:complete
MKKTALCLISFALGHALAAQNALYKWASGDSQPSRGSVVQTTGIGARENGTSWVDEEGNLWIFGGYGYDKNGDEGYFNDMWRYSIRDKEWTWMHGANYAGAIADYEADLSLRFDGLDDVVEMVGFKDYHMDFTWEIWIKTEAEEGTVLEYAESTKTGECCSGVGNISLAINDGYAKAFTEVVSDTYAQSFTRINDGQWHHLALTFKANQSGNQELVTLFVDGTEEASFLKNFDQVIPHGVGSAYVTKLGNGFNGPLNAVFDNFRVWKSARTSEEIRINLVERLSGSEDDLIVYYAFDQGIANGDNQTEVDVFDQTPNGNNGTLDEFIKYPNLDGEVTFSKIWSIAKSAAAIEAEMATADPGDPGLLMYYDFRHGSAGGDNTFHTSVNDHSSNGNHGTLNNFDLIGDASNYLEDAISPFFTNNLSIIYSDDFELGGGDWTPDGPSDGFEWGVPTYGIPADYDNSWVTDLDGDATELSGTFYLTSQLFDFSTTAYAYISFDLYLELWGHDDVLWLEGSLDGTNWERIGNSETGVNWYDGVSGLFGEEGWHYSNGWRTAYHELSRYNYESQVYFRFVFLTDGCCAEELAGIAIDNISVFTNSEYILSFDGIDDYVSVPNVNQYNSDFTWETWVKTDDDATIFSYSNPTYSEPAEAGAIALYILDGQLIFEQHSNAAVGAYSLRLDDDFWHHVAVTVAHDTDGSLDQISLYVDGELAGSDLVELQAIPVSGMATHIGQSNFDFPLVSGGLGAGDYSNWIDDTVLPKSSIGGRAQALGLTNSDGDFFMFGGYGLNEFATAGQLNAIHQYDRENNSWILVAGLESIDEPGVYGVMGVANASNHPGGRSYPSGWMDADDNIWIFGGYGYDAYGTLGHLNDLWKYNSQTGNWTWMGGEDYKGVGGTYGTLGEGSTSNMPGSRANAVTWTDSNGDFWLFGGYSEDYDQYFNDLWRYNIESGEWTWVAGNDFLGEDPVYGTLGEPSDESLPGGRSGAAAWYGDDGKLWLFGGHGKDNYNFRWWMNDLWSFNPTTGQWAWEGGPTYGGNSGIYGSLGEANIDNNPGSRRDAAEFKSSDGSFWLFGGSELGYYNDLFQLNPSSLEWTWWGGNDKPIKEKSGHYGVPGNGQVPTPGGRMGAIEWVDNDGDLWLLGGTNDPNEKLGGTDDPYKKINGFFNDLWTYDQSTQSWKYLGGSLLLDKTSGNYGAKGISSSSNIPPPRLNASSWYGTDGNLWFFGGKSPSSARNDLWKYDPDENTYTWIGGSSIEGQRGVYGTKGVEGASSPGARYGAASWVDKEGMFWLFGGAERGNWWDKTFNDLWRYNPSTNKWTWFSGFKSSELPGIFGQKGVPASKNAIGSKAYAKAWTDSAGNIWVFGGFGWDIAGNIGAMNDLWMYNIESGVWMWVSGSEGVYDYGYYGTPGVADPANVPPARYDFEAWTDDAGDFWLFGGTDGFNPYNDLWKYDLQVGGWAWMGGADFTGAPDEYGSKGEPDQLNVIGARHGHNAFKGVDKNLWVYGGKTLEGFKNDLWEISFVPGTPRVDDATAIEQSGFDVAYEEAWALTFDVEISESEDFLPLKASFSESARILKVSALEAGTRYFFRVKAYSDNGESDYSATKQVLTLPVTPIFPDQAEDKLSNISQSAFTAHWIAPPGIFEGYYLDVSTEGSFESEEAFVPGHNAQLVDAEATSIEVGGLSSGTEYFLRLRTFNESGQSPSSEVIRIVTTPDTPGLADNKGISELLQTSASIGWEPVQGIFDGFIFDVSTDGSFASEEAFLEGYHNKLLSKTTAVESLAGLQPGSRYYARVFAYNESGSSNPTETITILTLPATPIFTGSDFLTDISQTSARLKWSVVPEVLNGYHLEVSTDFNFTNPAFALAGYGSEGVLKSIHKDTVFHQLTILEAGKTYFARVRAYNSSGNSPYSNVITIRSIPRAPVLNAVSNITQVSAILSWSVPDEATSYLVDLNTNQEFESSGSVLKDFPSAVPFYSLEKLLPGQDYYVKVQSVNTSGRSGQGSTPDFGVTSFITIPNAPQLRPAANIGQSVATLSWPPVKGAQGYEVDVSNNGFQTLVSEFNGLPVADTMLVLSGLEAGRVFQARVRSANGSGKSPVSNIQNVLMVPPTPIARDASSITPTSFRANWDPVTGATGYLLEVSGDGFATFVFQQSLLNANPVDIIGLSQANVLTYRVSSSNESGVSPYSNVVTVSLSPPPLPVAINSLSFSATYKKGQQQSLVKMAATGGSGELTSRLTYRGIAQNQWSEAQSMLRDSNDDFVFAITAELLDALGLEFEIEVSDGSTSIFRRENFIFWEFDDTQSDTIPFSVFGGKKSDWQMFSIPYVLKDNFIETIFNETGPLRYKVDWRILHYESDGKGGGKYLDKGEGINKIELGKGYWFNAVKPIKINIGSGQVNGEIPFQISLTKGWNQIGNPFNVPISWEETIASNNLSGTAETLKVFDNTSLTFIDGDLVAPFSGGFVWVEENSVAQVSPFTSPPGGRQLDQKEVKTANLNIDGSDWAIPFSLQGGLYSIGGFGMHPDASHGKDALDKMLLPRFVFYNELYTRHEDYFYPWFATDIATTAQAHVWEFNFRSNTNSRVADLTWDNTGLQSRTASLYLLDRSSGSLIDMKKHSSFTAKLTDGAANFEVYYQADGGLPEFKHLFLGTAYPNPATNRTTIPVLLPTGPQRDLHIDIFDLNGGRVKRVVEGSFGPGFYEFECEFGRQDIPAGLYIYQLVIENSDMAPLQKKLLLR